MRTRSRRAENGGSDQGSLSKTSRQSPQQKGRKGRQPLQQRNTQAVLSNQQPPVSSMKGQTQVASLKENLKENGLSSYDGISPIIGNRRRRVIGVKSAGIDSGCESEGTKKKEGLPLKIGTNNRQNNVSLLQEKKTTIIAEKRKTSNGNFNKSDRPQERLVQLDKENVLADYMSQPPIRQSKRIRVPNSRYKDMLDTPKRTRKDQPNQHSETKRRSVANSSLEENTVNVGKKILGDSQGSQEGKSTKRKKAEQAKTPEIKEKESNGEKSRRSFKADEKTLKRSKQPIWASVRGTKMTPGERKSLRLSNDAYEFTGSPSKEHKEVKKRKVSKPRRQVKKRRPGTKLKLLTTDPSWQCAASKAMPFLISSSASSSSSSRSTKTAASQDSNQNTVAEETSMLSTNKSDIRNEDSADHDVSELIYEGFDDNELQTFEDETTSSFVTPSVGPNKLIPMHSTNMLPRPGAPNDKAKHVENSSILSVANAIRTEASVPKPIAMTSATALPTPVVSKHITRFIGGSSTPRVEVADGVPPNQEATTANDSIAQCFGFNDDSEEENELNISPVQHSKQQSRFYQTLEMTGTSDVMERELHPASLPSRFSWGSLQPGYHSRLTTTNRSSSMVPQGRSTTFMTNSSSRSSQSKMSSFLVPTVAKQHSRAQKRRSDSHRNESSDSMAAAKSKKKQNQADISVLFDENELFEEAASEGKKVNDANNSDIMKPPVAEGTAAKSPEKHFPRAPRRSYDREALQRTRRKFIESHGGFFESSSDSEKEEPNVEDQTELKKNHQKVSKKSKKPAKGKGQETAKEKKQKKTTETSVRKKKAAGAAKNASLLEEWASQLNSHFSEVEKTILVVE